MGERWYLLAKISDRVVALANPGIPPRCAQEPKATTREHFSRRSLTHSSCSDRRTAPLMNTTATSPGVQPSTSLRFTSSATGHKAMSTASTTFRMSSARSTTVSSQPPHDAHQ